MADNKLQKTNSFAPKPTKFPINPPKKMSLFKLIAISLSAYLCAGTICFLILKDDLKGKTTNPFIDSIYFCVVTMTTVGYGDLRPNTTLTKLLACVFTFSGMAIVALIITKAADYLLQKQEHLLIQAFHQTPGEIDQTINKPTSKYNIVNLSIALSVFMIIGIGFLCLIEGLDFIDAVYCACCTMSTLGYGDKSFSTVQGRVFAVVWILGSTVCLGQLFVYVAENLTGKKRRRIVQMVLSLKTVTKFDLEEAIVDDDGVFYSVAEFVVYKLKEIGKINHEDVSSVLKELETLKY